MHLRISHSESLVERTAILSYICLQVMRANPSDIVEGHDEKM